MKTGQQIIWLFLMVTLFLQISCKNEKGNKVGNLENETYQITPMEFADEETIKILNHANVFDPVRFRIDYNTNKSRFCFWAEIWEKDQLEVKQILNSGASKDKEGLGKGSVEVEISKNKQMKKEFNRITINTIIRDSGTLFTSIDIEKSYGTGVISPGFKEKKDYTTSQKFYYKYACFGNGGCSSANDEFPFEVDNQMHTGKEIFIHYRGGFFNSSEEFISYLEGIYEKYRPVKSPFNVFPEDRLKE